MLQKLRTVIYHVNDIVAATNWYIKATGIQPYFNEPFYVGFDINGYEIGLDPSPDNFSSGNHTTSYWAVESAKAAAEKFISLGATLVQGATNVGGSIYVSVVTDPFGNNIGFIEGA